MSETINLTDLAAQSKLSVRELHLKLSEKELDPVGRTPGLDGPAGFLYDKAAATQVVIGLLALQAQKASQPPKPERPAKYGNTYNDVLFCTREDLPKYFNGFNLSVGAIIYVLEAFNVRVACKYNNGKKGKGFNLYRIEAVRKVSQILAANQQP